MPTKRSYYRDLPEKDKKKKQKEYPEDIKNILSDVYKYRLQKVAKKSPKMLGALFTLLIKGEKKLKK